MCRELLDTLESALAHASQEAGVHERESARKRYAQVLDTCKSLGIGSDHIAQMREDRRKEYQDLKRSVLMYLLYYDWLIRYADDRNAQLQWNLSVPFDQPDSNEWIDAALQAKTMVMEHKRAKEQEKK